jgi:hypothetical protein
MTILFVVLTVVIVGYTYITDSNRVRSMAQAYLSHLLGGRVEIGGATLSIFEGFRVDDVKLHVDPGADRPDSLLFSAQSFLVNYDPRKLLQGQLEATEIIAQKPHVYLTLTHTARGDEWNYLRLRKNQPPQPPGQKNGPTRISLPQLLLRNAVVEISETTAGRRSQIGAMDIDGQLTPVGDGTHYQFEMQSRGVSEGLGPYASGVIAVSTGELVAHLRNVQLSDDVRSMFPANLRDWWARHELSGRVESIDLFYTPASVKAHIAQKFSVQTTVKGVALAVHREEWTSHEESERWRRIQDSVSLLNEPFRLAGYGAPISSPDSPFEVLGDMVDTPPLRLREVTGTFLFTQDRIDVDGLLVRVATGDPNQPDSSNAFRVSGRMDGYKPDAPLHLEVKSADSTGIYFPARPTFIDSLPGEVRNFYNDVKPEGTCHLVAKVDRAVAGERPQFNARLDIVNARFLVRQLPYPISLVHGSLLLARDPASGKDYLNVVDVQGGGIAGGPNEHFDLVVNGRVGPIGPDSPEPGFDLHATGMNFSSDPALTAALPPDIHDAIVLFDARHEGIYPKFKVNFAADIHKDPGLQKRPRFGVDVDIIDAMGRSVGFPYLIRHASGRVHVGDGFTEVLSVTTRDGSSTASATGRVKYADLTGRFVPLDMDLKISVHNMPTNDELLAALPPDSRAWITKLGISGTLSCEGRIFTVPPPNWEAHYTRHQKPPDPPTQVDLALGIRDGTVWPADGLFSVSSVNANLHLTNDRLDILEAHARRENAEISCKSTFGLTGPSPAMSIHVSAQNLSVDRPLYSLVPPEGRKAWDEIRPQGVVDADIDYESPTNPATPTAVATAAPQVEIPEKDAGKFRVVIRPREVAVKLRTVPYPLTFTRGSVTIVPGKATLTELLGKHEQASLLVSGEGLLTAAPIWNLSARGEGFEIDESLRNAIPPMLRDIIDGLKLHGTVGLNFPKLVYRAAQASEDDPDIDVSGTLKLNRGSIDAGAPITDVRGGMKLDLSTRRGKFNGLSGALALDTLNLGGRPVSDLRLDFLRAAGQPDLHVDKLQAKVAGGELAGSAVIFFPDQGSNRYATNLVIRNADIKELTGEASEDVRGELTASLSLEGKWDDPSARRGRGDVVVVGKQLYRIPLMLGLMQVTNLSLPIGQPFTRATARYNVEGARVNFEQMDLRAESMSMSGTGYLDFGTKQVRLNLVTDNPSGFKIPFISDLWQGARQELLRINVEGTVQDPKVQPSSMGVITTTIDQVFKGDGAKKP